MQQVHHGLGNGLNRDERPRARSFNLSSTLLIFSICIALFTFIILDGHLLYFLNLPASPWLLLILIALQFSILIRWLARQPTHILTDPLELAGFLFVVVGIWFYFVYPSWPTLLPPSQSGDGANHAAYVTNLYSTGYLFSSYPAGPALIVATFAHWLDGSPLRLLHLTASFFLALTAGGIYGLACAMLPKRREYKTIALVSVAALFVPWGFFAGMLIRQNYFFTQAAAQLFVVAFVWFLNEYQVSLHPVWIIGLALTLIGISGSWQLWLFLPVAILIWTVLTNRAGSRPVLRQILLVVVPVLAVLVLFWATLLLTSPELLPRALGRLYEPSGAILEPSLDTLGAPLLVLSMLGVLFIFRSGYPGRVHSAFLLWTVLQTIALLIWHFQFGLGNYYTYKTFYLLILPLALFAMIPVARLVGLGRFLILNRVLASPLAFGAALIILCASMFFLAPAPASPVMAESDLRVASWAREHLDTSNINLIGRKSLLASWLGVGIWLEKYPADLFLDYAALGPKTFEEWRSDSSWGDYLFVSSRQKMPDDPTLQLTYQVGSSAILRKPGDALINQFPADVARFGDVFELTEIESAPQIIRTGATISLTTQIRTLGIPTNRVAWDLELLDSQNHSVAEARIDPFGNKYLLQRWPRGKSISQSFAITPGPDLDPGLYQLRLSLMYTGNGEMLPIYQPGKPNDETVSLQSLKVALPPVATAELQTIKQTLIKVGSSLELLGYRVESAASVHPGDSLQLKLFWTALEPVNQDYTVFVHLLDPGGAIKFQRDSAPRDGHYPTSIWSPREVIVDSYTVDIPAAAIPGDYQIEVGMYHYPDLRRLPLADDTHALGDHLVLPIHVSPRDSN